MRGDEFTDRHNLGETAEESHPEHQQPRRRIFLPSSPDPSGGSPGRPMGRPIGRLFQKRWTPAPGGPPARPTGLIRAPERLPSTFPGEGGGGFPGFDSEHPLPVQLPRDCWNYLFNLLRQMHLHVEEATWIKPPARARPLDYWTQLSGESVAAGATETIIQGPFVIPTGHLGIIARIGMSMGDSAGWSFMHFRIRKNGVNVERYGDITMQIGEPAAPTRLAAPILLRGKDTIDLVATNDDAVPHTAYGRLYGWVFPVQVETSDGSARERIVD